MSSLCLCMIVKDESHILRTTLENLVRTFTFQYWVICDTGSSDTTKQILTEFFSERHIDGELHDDPWSDFGTNRTKALERAFNTTDYVLMFDADDAIEGTISLPNPLTSDSYGLLFRVGDASFHRHVLLNNRKRWKYVGVLHEYLECLEPSWTKTLLLGTYTCIGRTLGNRSKNPRKYQDDAETLQAAYDEATARNDPIRNRYAFYCANSYKDCGMYTEALQWYTRVLTLENWAQEKYIACLRIYELYDALNTPDLGLYALVESLRYDNERVECIHLLIASYLMKGMTELAYKYYECIQEYYETKYPQPSYAEKLFVRHDIPNFYFPYNMIVLSDRVKKYATGVAMYRILFRNQYVPSDHWYLGHLFNNLAYFRDHILKESVPSFLADLRAYVQQCTRANYVYTPRQQAILGTFYALEPHPGLSL